MKPLIILAIAAVAAGALGTGFLNNTNGINLWIQQFGVGEGDIMSPVTHAFVDFDIQRIPTVSGAEGTFDNVIKNCVLKFNDNLGPGAKVFCKLTDWAGDIISEGSTVLVNSLSTNTQVTVPIGPGGNNNVLQVKDVIIIVQANAYTESPAATIAP